MTQKEILEGNKLINEYLGLPLVHKVYTAAINNNGGRYHESLDWLQPVLDKIVYNFEEFSINGSRLMTGGDHTEYECEIYTTGYQCITQARGISNNMVEAIYKACIQYIQKYNTKTLTQPTK